MDELPGLALSASAAVHVTAPLPSPVAAGFAPPAGNARAAGKAAPSSGKRFSARSKSAADARSNDDLTVFVIDPDLAFRDAVTLTLAYRGYCLRQFSSQQEFVAARSPGWCGCVLATLDTDTGAGLDLLSAASEVAMPVVLTAPTADLGWVRRAFLAGAIDVLPKPIDLDDLLAAVDRAMAQARRGRPEAAPARRAESGLKALTRRESEVAQLMRQGFGNRSIGDRLGISHRTVEVHKTRLMRKLGMRSLAELMALPVPAPKMRASGRVNSSGVPSHK